MLESGQSMRQMPVEAFVTGEGQFHDEYDDLMVEAFLNMAFDMNWMRTLGNPQQSSHRCNFINE